MINLQNKIDRLITSGNIEFAENRNVICALVDYQRALDIFEYLEKEYKIQYHELLVRIAICYDILGNYNRTIDYLTKAMKLVPNICNLVLYKSVLYFANGDHNKGIKLLNKFKNLSQGIGKENLYQLFKLVFSFVEGSSKKKILDELTVMLNDKSKRYALAYYLKAIIYLEIDKEKKEMILSNNNSLNAFNNISELTTESRITEEYKLYEKNLKLAEEIDSADTDFLIKDGISSENLTKIFFMILPEMDDYQPKVLANYNTFHSGIGLFFTLKRCCKLFSLFKTKQSIINTLKKSDLYNLKEKSIKFNPQIFLSYLKTLNKSIPHKKINVKEHISNVNLNDNNDEFKIDIYNLKVAKFIYDVQLNLKLIFKSSIFTYYYSLLDDIIFTFINKNLSNFSSKVSSTAHCSNNSNDNNIEDTLFLNHFVKNLYYSPYNIKSIYKKYMDNDKLNENNEAKVNDIQNIDISRVSLDNNPPDESLILSFFKEIKNDNKGKITISAKKSIYSKKLTNKIYQPHNENVANKEKINENIQLPTENIYNILYKDKKNVDKQILEGQKSNISSEKLPKKKTSTNLVKNNKTTRDCYIKSIENDAEIEKENTIEGGNQNYETGKVKFSKTSSDYLFTDPGSNVVINLKKKINLKESDFNLIQVNNNINTLRSKFPEFNKSNQITSIQNSQNIIFKSGAKKNENPIYYKPEEIHSVKFNTDSKNKNFKLSANKVSMNSIQDSDNINLNRYIVNNSPMLIESNNSNNKFKLTSFNSSSNVNNKNCNSNKFLVTSTNMKSPSFKNLELPMSTKNFSKLISTSNNISVSNLKEAPYNLKQQPSTNTKPDQFILKSLPSKKIKLIK